MRLHKLLVPVLLSTVLLMDTAVAADATKLYVFPDNASNRAAIVGLAAVDGITISAASSGDTTLVNLGGNGFDRSGFLTDGLHATDRQEFAYDGDLSATPADAASLDALLGQANIGPSIVIVPIAKLPPRCIKAVCLPPDWNKLADEGGIVGNGIFAFGPGHSGGFIALGGSGTSVGGGKVLGPGVSGGRVLNGTGVGSGQPTIVGQGRTGGVISGGFTINGMRLIGGQDGGG